MKTEKPYIPGVRSTLLHVINEASRWVTQAPDRTPPTPWPPSPFFRSGNGEIGYLPMPGGEYTVHAFGGYLLGEYAALDAAWWKASREGGEIRHRGVPIVTVLRRGRLLANEFIRANDWAREHEYMIREVLA